MRRLFWAGVVGTLVYLPVRADAIAQAYTSIFLEGPVSFSDSLLPLESARVSWFIDLFGHVLGYDTPKLILYLLIWLSATVIAVRTGVIGRIRPLGSGKILGFLFNRPGGLGGMAASFAAAAIIYYLSTRLLPFEHVFLSDSDLWYRALFFMGGPGMAAIYFDVLTLSMLPFVFAASVLGYALIVYKEKGELIAGARMSFVAFGLGAVWFVTLSEAAVSYDFRKDLGEVLKADCALEPERRDLHVLADLPASIEMPPMFHEMTYMKKWEGSAYYNAEGNQVAERYLELNGRTILNGPLHHYIINYYARRFDFDKVNEWRYRLFMSSGDNGPGYWLTNRLKYSNATGAGLTLADRLSDESMMHVPDKYYYTFAKIYLNQGDIDKAKSWYDRAGNAELSGQFDRLDEFEMPDTVPFHEGRIDGRILVDGKPLDGVSVGIIRSGSLPTFEAWMSDFGVDLWHMQACLTLVKGGVVADKDGRFAITGIHEDDYTLVLSVPVQDGDTHTVTNPPGVITISEDKPVADVGTIELAEQVRFPDAERFRSGLK